jgi:hypothetical protein
MESILDRWVEEGPVQRAPTGFPTLDAACRGGLPIPSRVIVVGAPSAGKTALVMVLLRRFIDAGVVCGILGVDEEPDDLCIRVAQMLGFAVDGCEKRDPEVLAAIRQAAKELPLRFYDYKSTIETAAADLAARAATLGKPAVLAVDSIQAARCDALLASPTAPGAREVVEANVRAMRQAATDNRMLVLSTSEANRGAYRSDEAIGASDDMAAGKDSSAIEYTAQVLLMVRTPKNYPNHLRVFVPKNRRGIRARFEFFLQLNREHHKLTECADPTTGDAAHEAAIRSDGKRRAAKLSTMQDARDVAKVLRASPGLGERELNGAMRAAGHIWGPSRLNGAKAVLQKGFDGVRLVNVGKPRRSEWRLEPCVHGERDVSDERMNTPERVHASPLKGDAYTSTPNDHALQPPAANTAETHE